jgi:hypothetical protein
LIVTGKEWDVYTDSDHDQALGFRVLASATIEDYIERRCLETAAKGADRFLKAQPTRTGRALLVWYTVRHSIDPIPLRDVEHIPDADSMKRSLEAYEKSVRSSHGIAGAALRKLILPLGVEATDLAPELFDKLESWAASRGAAAHVRVNRVREMTTPEADWARVADLLGLLAELDDSLTRVCENF